MTNRIRKSVGEGTARTSVRPNSPAGLATIARTSAALKSNSVASNRTHNARKGRSAARPKCNNDRPRTNSAPNNNGNGSSVG